MSIFPAVIEELKRENAFRPIAGDVLLIGRQTVEGSTLTDTELFQQFPEVVTVNALDVSAYEGADIVWDLNVELPDRYASICDFIFDGSCLDNVFDPAMAIRSLSKMLRPGGRMMLVEHGTAIQGAVLCFSPEWFFDFFAANGYEDCWIKLFAFPNGIYGGPWVPIPWEPYHRGEPVSATPGTLIGDFVSVVVAEKRKDSTSDKIPIQAQYRAMHGDPEDEYKKAWQRFMNKGRR
jgi:SAM-dependent methyltransferase